MSVRYLSLEDLLALAHDLGQLVVRDVGLLDSAAHRPQSTVFGEDAYESIHQKAAVLLESILTNHPLVDGNKRLGWLSVYAFYGLNGYTLDAPDDAAYDLVISVASGDVGYRLAADALEEWVFRSC
ncbi:type II toxin-antitoxin system death-on-curing family toxin [Mycolicibacterium stellerae]|uniref:type II toxin-antitoxin system death-on-curing family toxin n=1 Tax=Mycolicibacterium stellerae TaxID=2358193 RepID=UPI000F0B7A19|nr:type II toxin-antitoxin system death-on-curing family toxin [Mycolicibacterium stellerae]